MYSKPHGKPKAAPNFSGKFLEIPEAAHHTLIHMCILETCWNTSRTEYQADLRGASTIPRGMVVSPDRHRHMIGSVHSRQICSDLSHVNVQYHTANRIATYYTVSGIQKRKNTSTVTRVYATFERRLMCTFAVGFLCGFSGFYYVHAACETHDRTEHRRATTGLSHTAPHMARDNRRQLSTRRR